MHPEDAQQLIGLRTFDNGRNAAVTPFLFTWAIIADITDTGYEDRWCYESLAEAMGALDDWDGNNEPEGWHRHPASGRRRTKEGEEYINP